MSTHETPLDAAHAAMQAASSDDTARLRFYDRLADAELFVLLENEPENDRINPVLHETDQGTFLLAFDRADRLAQYVGQAAPFVALSGRAVAAMLDGQDLGLAVNLTVAPSAILLPAGALGWLRDTLHGDAEAMDRALARVMPPKGLPESLITALDAKLATATGMAQCAYLAGAEYRDGTRGHLLGFIAAQARAQDALVRATSEALTFSGIDAGTLDVGFFAPDDPLVAHLATQGLRFDLPQPEGLQHTPRLAPGSDPSKPPILK